MKSSEIHEGDEVADRGDIHGYLHGPRRLIVVAKGFVLERDAYDWRSSDNTKRVSRGTAGDIVCAMPVKVSSAVDAHWVPVVWKAQQLQPYNEVFAAWEAKKAEAEAARKRSEEATSAVEYLKDAGVPFHDVVALANWHRTHFTKKP